MFLLQFLYFRMGLRKAYSQNEKNESVYSDIAYLNASKYPESPETLFCLLYA